MLTAAQAALKDDLIIKAFEGRLTAAQAALKDDNFQLASLLVVDCRTGSFEGDYAKYIRLPFC